MDLGKHLMELTGTAGMTGHEGALARLLQTRWAPYVDECRVDHTGNCLGVRRGQGERPPRVLVTAHLDSIGLMVTEVVSGGFLRVALVGGVDRRYLAGLEVWVQGSQGPLPGLVGSRPPHLTSPKEREKAPRTEELWIDLGLAEAEVRAQVAPGAPVTFRQPVGPLLNERYAGAYMDDRAGVACLTAALMELAALPRHQAELWFGGTMGEEFNMVGARTAAYDLQPDVAIAVDVAFGVSPGADDDTHFPLEGGPTIMVGPNCHRGLFRYMRETADRLGIPYGVEVNGGRSGTDAWAMQVAGRGSVSGVLSVPIRYMHNPAETISLADVRQTGRLLAHVLHGIEGGLVAAWTSLS